MSDLTEEVLEAVVDHSICGGIGMCEATAPGTFEVTDDGQARVLAGQITPDALPAVSEAVDNCPMGALSIRGRVPGS